MNEILAAAVAERMTLLKICERCRYLTAFWQDFKYCNDHLPREADDVVVPLWETA